MHKSQGLNVALGFAAGAALIGGGQIGAATYSPVGYVEGFENDTDGYNPANNSFSATPIGHSMSGSNTFSAGTGYPGLHPNQTSATGPDDWSDARGGVDPFPAHGIIEEVPTGTEGVPSYAGTSHGLVLHGHDTAPSGPDDGTSGYGGPIGAAGRQNANPGGADNMWANRVHFYVNPNMPTSNDGQLSFTWDSSVQRSDGGGPYGGYMSETNMYWDVANAAGNQNGGAINGILVDSDAAGGPVFIPDVVGQWLTAEVLYFPGQDGNVNYRARLWSGDETTLLADLGVSGDYLNGALGTGADLGGPRIAFWFYNTGHQNVNSSDTDIVGWAVDNLVAGVEPIAVPEPSSLTVLAGGAGALWLRRRRRA